MNTYIRNLINRNDDDDGYDDYEKAASKPNVIKLYNELASNRQIMVLRY